MARYEVSVLRHNDPAVGRSPTCDLAVRRSVAIREVERVNGVVPELTEAMRQAPRKLRVDEKPHAASGRMRCVRVTAAA